jgi:hypothetical protein
MRSRSKSLRAESPGWHRRVNNHRRVSGGAAHLSSRDDSHASLCWLGFLVLLLRNCLLLHESVLCVFAAYHAYVSWGFFKEKQGRREGNDLQEINVVTFKARKRYRYGVMTYVLHRLRRDSLSPSMSCVAKTYAQRNVWARRTSRDTVTGHCFCYYAALLLAMVISATFLMVRRSCFVTTRTTNCS